MSAHVAGVPLEELLSTLAGASGMLALARGRLALHRHRHPKT